MLLAHFAMKTVQKPQIKIKSFGWSKSKIKHFTIRKYFDKCSSRTFI